MGSIERVFEIQTFLEHTWAVLSSESILQYRYSICVTGSRLVISLSMLKFQTSYCSMAPKLLPFPWLQIFFWQKIFICDEICKG